MQDAYKLLEGGMHMITDAVKLMPDLLSYPFHDTLSRLLAELSVHLVLKLIYHCLDCSDSCVANMFFMDII